MISANASAATQAAADALVTAVQSTMLTGYSDVHGNPPHTEIYDTGALYASINADVEQVSETTYLLTVGTDRYYAVYVHDGTYKLKGRPFIRDGIMGAKDELSSIFVEELSRGME
jgi:HK97 gp10 family phage protein